ncbi:hypothetical protein XO10_10010 [Marinitoga sp. 1135]|uniref:Transposase n=1 Tax=Marinitoga piezophila (strain DSM 14283 / JCM 11233 / KA3) TaxID=443254 RepID=H2J736_MARPK|nr:MULTISPECIES: transposase [Marinitoga]AEX86406.1 transposase [Marinitoga piezophila KA3]APT76796.1 hypothetical protein LN42_10730 [Marinitoga sp. 1137]NUU96564.1 hypothetical protein [Marinitoga sp. 1135]NUU98495.1 hypothetical protein [Marinitoga sp. 1138]
MDLIKKLKDDSSAERFLIEAGILNIKSECPYCGSKEVYTIRRNHFKCKSCRREWSRYNGTIFKDIRIKPLKFVRIVHELAEGKMIKKISEDLNVSYNTVLKIRKLILKRFIKRIFGVEDVGDFFAVGIKYKDNNIDMKYFEECNIENLKNIENEKLGRLYIFKDINNYDVFIIFSEKPIKILEKNSKKINLQEARKEFHEFIKHFSDSVVKGKLSNGNSLLFALAQSHVVSTHGNERLFYIFLELLKQK